MNNDLKYLEMAEGHQPINKHCLWNILDLCKNGENLQHLVQDPPPSSLLPTLWDRNSTGIVYNATPSSLFSAEGRISYPSFLILLPTTYNWN
jgi:hypothetical protein